MGSSTLLHRRLFHSRAAHTEWVRRVVRSRKARPPQLVESSGAAPMLCEVEPMYGRLRCFAVPDGALPEHTPSASLVEVEYPLATDAQLRKNVADMHAWSPFRLSKFYEALDALTGDAAYRHVNAGVKRSEPELALVTAGHYHSLKLGKTVPGRNTSLRCYVTGTGSSTVEVRTDGLQADDNGVERLVNVCHTIMVALDAETMTPVRGSVAPLRADEHPTDAHHEERAALAALHKEMRLKREHEAVGLRGHRVSHPPTAAEMEQVHELHRTAALRAERPQEARPDNGRVDTVAHHTHTACFVAFPEQRNVHGKLFGGWVTGTAFDIAYYAARFFVRGRPFVPHRVGIVVLPAPHTARALKARAVPRALEGPSLVPLLPASAAAAPPPRMGLPLHVWALDCCPRFPRFPRMGWA